MLRDDCGLGVVVHLVGVAGRNQCVPSSRKAIAQIRVHR